MIDARFVPIEHWPVTTTPPNKQKNATFRASYSSTLDLLEEELNKLSAKNVTIQAHFTRQDIRNDGWPRSHAVPSASGAILSFDTRKLVNGKWEITELSFPCDTFTTFDDNLRAIALALEALRKIARYGVTRTDEQYKGWAKLPPPSNPDSMTREDAAGFIAGYSGVTVEAILHNGFLDQAYKRAAQVLHPDKQNGSHELFVRLQKAKEVLER